MVNGRKQNKQTDVCAAIKVLRYQGTESYNINTVGPGYKFGKNGGITAVPLMNISLTSKIMISKSESDKNKSKF